jgi:hypothetical protein
MMWSRIITDRYALPAGADTTKCDPGAQTWCGGTWKTIMNNLDYIQVCILSPAALSPHLRAVSVIPADRATLLRRMRGSPRSGSAP